MTYEELLEKADIDGFSSTTRRLLTEVTADITLLAAGRNIPDSEYLTIADGIHSLGVLEDTRGGPSIEDYFELQGFGHFKECYYLSPNFVIKFCAERNPTLEEAKLLSDAYENGFEDLFLPSKYHELPFPLPSDNLEKEDDDQEVYDEDQGQWVDNPEWHDNTVLTHICIQPQVISAERFYADPSTDNTYNKPVDAECNCGSKHSWEITRTELGLPEDAWYADYRGLNGLCLIWARDFIKRFGVARLKMFSHFCEEFHVWDLHGENVGYTLPGADGTRYPIILDWMSR